MRLFLFLLAGVLSAQTWDLVIGQGRVIDPETGLDGVRWIGISGRTRFGAVSTEPLQGRTTIDAKGLVVAPGFIDLHEHGQDFEAYTFQARDGVTSTFELEVGTADVPGWYKARENKSARPTESLSATSGAHEGHEGPGDFCLRVRAPGRRHRRIRSRR